MAFEEPEQAHADHFQHQDIDPEMATKLQTASMLLGQVLRKGNNLLSMPENKRKNVVASVCDYFIFPLIPVSTVNF